MSVCVRACRAQCEYSSTFSNGKYAMYRDWVFGIYVCMCLHFSVCTLCVTSNIFMHKVIASLSALWCVWCTPNVISASFFLRCTVVTQNKNKKSKSMWDHWNCTTTKCGYQINLPNFDHVSDMSMQDRETSEQIQTPNSTPYYFSLVEFKNETIEKNICWLRIERNIVLKLWIASKINVFSWIFLANFLDATPPDMWHTSTEKNKIYCSHWHHYEMHCNAIE